MNKQALAQALYDAFEKATRTSGEEFVKIADGSPEWMSEAVRAAHGDMFIDDVRYSMVREVAGELADKEDWEDAPSEIAGSCVDVYNAELLRWLSSNLHRAFYCDEAREEGLVSEDTDLYERIRQGQYQEYREVCDLLINFLEEREEQEEEEQEGDEE
jgi:hypothetical protein